MNSKGRAIIIVIDGLGVGTENENSPNTLRSLVESRETQEGDSLTYRDLCSFIDNTSASTASAVVTPSYEGADSYKGHYEMIGIDVGTDKVFLEEYKDIIVSLYTQVKELSNGVFMLQEKYFLSNNIEAELGTSINLIGDLNKASKNELIYEGKRLSRSLGCQRVIVMAGRTIPQERILKGIARRDDCSGRGINGIIPSLCELYDDDYFTYHVGRPLDSYMKPNLIDTIIDSGHAITLVGKVGEIFQEKRRVVTNIASVKSSHSYDNLLKTINNSDAKLIFGNFQQVDLMSHACKPREAHRNLLEVCRYIDHLRSVLDPNDIMLITADHGNDPTYGNAHTRERVPLLVYGSELSRGSITKTYDSLACVFAIANDHLRRE